MYLDQPWLYQPEKVQQIQQSSCFSTEIIFQIRMICSKTNGVFILEMKQFRQLDAKALLLLQFISAFGI